MGPMTRRLFVFDEPDRFVAGTIGDPGERAFYLQARKGGAMVSVAIEKVQVAALAERLDDLLDAVDAPPRPVDADAVALEEPIVELFRVGAMALAWDARSQAVVIEAQTPTEDGEYAELPDDADEGPDLLRVRIDAPSARAFVQRAEALLGAGRPACPFCGQPLDPQGHFCSLGNGQGNGTLS
jgi:uncharacterized repeat protein (TIGR03847 family)